MSSSLAIFTGPVLGPGSNKFGTLGALTRKDKKEKKRRNKTVQENVMTPISNDKDSNSFNNSVNTSNSQWYTSDADSMSLCSMNSNLSVFSSSTTPVIELRQEVMVIIQLYCFIVDINKITV